MLRIDRDVIGWIRAWVAISGAGIQETLRESVIIGLQQIGMNVRMLGRGSELPRQPAKLCPPHQHVVPTPHGELAFVHLPNAVRACERVFEEGMRPHQRMLWDLTPMMQSPAESGGQGNIPMVAAVIGQPPDKIYADTRRRAREMLPSILSTEGRGPPSESL